ncbi:alpha/beta fold hydrolase [Porphyrobacter sp. AAP82]|uniref:alpha/beta fold hydrolase n=1 Tax=Porphyrobacter sp. AAP82 TaxID=1248917 RepID=UPI0003128D33|nr:alpha/beta hydrolase [Porphyrobacter sp. AAP82]
MLAARTPEPDAPWYGEVAVHGGTLPIWMAGAVDSGAAPLILLHGWTLDHRMWSPQVSGELARGHFLVMPDRRGCGRASAPPDLSCEAEDVIAIADFLGFERFALAGLSRGAVVALDVARRYGSRLTALVVSGAPLPALVAREEVIDLERYRSLARTGNLAAFRAEWAHHPLMRTHSAEAARLAGAMLADYAGRDLVAGGGEAPGLPREVLGMLPMPVLSMTGEHDTPWRRACARALGEVAPRARHVEIAQAGHLANADNPADFDAAVSAFLRACAARPR